MTKVLITGAGGFCGQHLVRYLQTQNVDVWTMGAQTSTAKQHCTISDITSGPEISAVLQSVQPNFIIHLAGVSWAESEAEYYQVNAGYAAALLQALELSGLSRTCPTLLMGTSAEYGAISPDQLPIHESTSVSPYHHYGISKLAQTQMGTAMARTGRPLVMVRPFNIIGPGMPRHLALQTFATQVAKISRKEQAPVIEVGNLSSSRDFVDVDDVVMIIWKLIRNPEAYGQIVNICSGHGTVMSDLLSMLIEVAEVQVKVAVDQQRFKALDVPVHFGCTNRLLELSGIKPKTDLRQTLKRVLDAAELSLVTGTGE